MFKLEFKFWEFLLLAEEKEVEFLFDKWKDLEIKYIFAELICELKSKHLFKNHNAGGLVIVEDYVFLGVTFDNVFSYIMKLSPDGCFVSRCITNELTKWYQLCESINKKEKKISKKPRH